MRPKAFENDLWKFHSARYTWEHDSSGATLSRCSKSRKSKWKEEKRRGGGGWGWGGAREVGNPSRWTINKNLIKQHVRTPVYLTCGMRRIWERDATMRWNHTCTANTTLLVFPIWCNTHTNCDYAAIQAACIAWHKKTTGQFRNWFYIEMPEEDRREYYGERDERIYFPCSRSREKNK